MLKLKHLYENFDLARECLKRYDVEEASLNGLLSRFRVSSNAVYPFLSLSTGKLCFLRLAPAEEKMEEEVASEVRLTEWLAGRGFPAMKPYPMTDGSLYTTAETEWGVYRVSCYEGVPGDTLEDCEGSPSLVKGYGRLLGKLHGLVKEYPFPETRRDHLALLEEIGERFERYGAPSAMKAERERVAAELARLPRSADVYGVIHYDFEADNVLYDRETDSFGVIDFDDAIRCWYALDLARAIDNVEDVAGEAAPERAEAAFLAGYREENAFTEEQYASLPLMRRLVRLQEYATILHVLSEPVPDMPDWMEEITEKLRRRKDAIPNGIG